MPSVETYVDEKLQVVHRIMQPVFAGISQSIHVTPVEDYTVLTVENVDYQPVHSHVYSLETSEGTVIAASGMCQHNCFPKDVKALANMALIHGTHPQLINAVMEINDFQRKHLGMKIRQLLGDSVAGKTIGILGLAFKPNTDDIRDAPALTIARTLINQGATVRAYDPVAMENVRAELPGIELVKDPYAVADGADILVVLTDWNEFKQLDMKRVKSLLNEPLLVDGRNIYKPEDMHALGFVYRGVGRGFNGEGLSADGAVVSGD
jgi:nucleotide sugar dehydrogenase